MFKIDKDTIFILGAGFTRAFSDNAPLLMIPPRKVGLHLVKSRYKAFPDIIQIVQSLIKGKEIDVEDLLSRLYTGSPYEAEFLSRSESKILYDFISHKFTKLIHGINIEEGRLDLFKNFAQQITKHSSSCITFNYDTTFDKALFAASNNKWHPDGGYGFFCLPAKDLISGETSFMDDCQTLLLKLHGSVNWHVKKGYKPPYSIDSIVHYDNWSDSFTTTQRKQLELHIEKSSLIIPPIFNKSELGEQPALQLIWSEAFRKLNSAKKIVFIGYSLPKTDNTARYLFRETLSEGNQEIKIITTNKNLDAKLNAYKEIIPKIERKNFYTKGAFEWIKNNISKN